MSVCQCITMIDVHLSLSCQLITVSERRSGCGTWHAHTLSRGSTRLYAFPCRLAERDGPSVHPQHFWIASGFSLHHCRCPTVCDCPSVYPALFYRRHCLSCLQLRIQECLKSVEGCTATSLSSTKMQQMALQKDPGVAFASRLQGNLSSILSTQAMITSTIGCQVGKKNKTRCKIAWNLAFTKVKKISCHKTIFSSIFVEYISLR